MKRTKSNTKQKAQCSPLKTPEKAVSSEDYVTAASIIASCPEERLHTVLRLLKRAGIPVNLKRDDAFKEADEDMFRLVYGFIQNNRERFTDETDGEKYGFFSDDGEKVFILAPVLYEELRKEGYSPCKSLRYLAEQDAIVPHCYRDGKRRFTVKKYYHGNADHHFVECRIRVLDANAVEQLMMDLP